MSSNFLINENKIDGNINENNRHSIEIIDISERDISFKSTKNISEVQPYQQERSNEDEKKEHGKSDSDDENWARLSEWIHVMCVVTFDLNLGQAVEFVYPEEFTPTDQEISNICYMAFPDSNSGCMGDTKFHMRLRVSYDGKHCRSVLSNNDEQHCFYNADCVPVLRADQSHFWGFVYFRQKRDANLPRGYFQKSFIIVTRLPFFNLYYEIVGLLAPKFFDEGYEIIKEACKQINTWPSLKAGASLKLPIFDHQYTVFIPRASSRKAITTNKDSSTNKESNCDVTHPPIVLTNKVIPSINEMELFYSLEFILDNLYTLWELVLTAEPIVVVGTSPADCSHMVQCLVALIAPLEYCAEHRPYFTIHDSEFKEFTRECGRTPPSVMLGVTNPFFVKLLKDWPHILRLVDKQINVQQPLYQRNVKNANSSATSFGNGSNLSGISCTSSNPTTLSFKKSANLINTSLTNSSSFGSSDGTAPGLYSKYKPFLKKDKALIKKIMLGVKTKRPDHVQTALLRRNLLELTQSFMIPLERYVASLMPLQKDISPFKSAPTANAFKLDDFLATLELSGPHLTSPLKGDWRGLYRRFFNSPNFRGWYEARHRELQLTLQELQLQALSEANLEHWAQDKQEVEIIDMILKLKQKLNLYSEKLVSENGGETTTTTATHATSSSVALATTTSTLDQLRAQINCMKELLPNDLKNVVNV